MDTRENERICQAIQKLAIERGVTLEQARELMWAERDRLARRPTMPRGKGSRSPYNRPKTKRR